MRVYCTRNVAVCDGGDPSGGGPGQIAPFASPLGAPDSGHQLGPSKTVLITEVHLYCNGTTVNPYYRSVLLSEVVVGPLLTVLIIEVSLFQSVHNSRFDCTLFSIIFLTIITDKIIANVVK